MRVSHWFTAGEDDVFTADARYSILDARRRNDIVNFTDNLGDGEVAAGGRGPGIFGVAEGAVEGAAGKADEDRRDACEEALTLD